MIRSDKPELLLKQNGFNVSRKTVIYAGGRGQRMYVYLLDDLINSYLAAGTHNVLYFDYHIYHDEINEEKLTLYLEKVTKQYAKALLKLIDAGLPANNIEIVGYSLGAKLIALIGYYTYSKLGLLVGLDPPTNVFNKAYGQYTIAVFTSRGHLSDINVNGHVHYMVNNGTEVQPGCPDEDMVIAHFCSHLRSLLIWINIIRYPWLFIGVPCNETFCDYDAIAQLGPGTRLYGQFYFRTKATSPFAFGLDGAKR